MSRKEWVLAALILLACVVVAFAVIGWFTWMGLVQLDSVPCPCRETP